MSRAFRGTIAALGILLSGACVTVKGGREGKPDADAATALRSFAQAVESLDTDKVMAWYAPDAFSGVLDRSPRQTTGQKPLRDEVARTLAQVSAMRVQPVGEVRAWREGDRAWTVQDFHVTGTLKDGRGFTLDVRFSAVWRRIGGKWLIEYEHFTGPTPTAKTTPPSPA